MENASKALVLAGAVLIVIALVSISISIVVKTNKMRNIAQNDMELAVVLNHNKKFSEFEGDDVSYFDMKKCVSSVLINNSNEGSYIINLIIGTKDSKTGIKSVKESLSDIELVKDKMNDRNNECIGEKYSSSSYEIQCEYCEDKIINNIYIYRIK